MPWLIGALPVALLMLRDLAFSNGGLIGSAGDAVFWGRDFINVWTGGQLVRSGQIATLYDLQAYAAYQQALFPGILLHNYSYPPVSYPLAALFSMLPYGLALPAWLGSTGALFLWAARPWWPDKAGWPVLALATPAALVNIWAGHYGFLIGALFLLGWRNAQARPACAGLCFGLMLIKPHLAVLVPLALALRGCWRTIGWAAATVGALLAVTCLLYGVQPWIDYLLRTGSFQASLIDAGDSFHRTMSPSIMMAVLHFGGSEPLAAAVQLAFAGLAVWMLTKAAPIASLRDFALLTATLTFLVLPYAFNYDMTVVMIGAAWVLGQNGLSPLRSRLAIGGFVAPTVGLSLAICGFQIMALLVAGLAYLQYSLIRQAEHRRCEPQQGRRRAGLDGGGEFRLGSGKSVKQPGSATCDAGCCCAG